jgi:hypothetical protein
VSVNFDFARLSTTQPKTENSYSASSKVNSISFAGIDDDVLVTRANVKFVQLYYWDSENLRYLVLENEGAAGHLSIRLDTMRPQQLFSFDFDVFRLNTTSRQFIITVPNDFAGSLELRTVSGQIMVSDNITDLVRLATYTVSGETYYNLEQVKTIVSETVSGDIYGYAKGSVDSAAFSAISANVALEFGSVGALQANTVSGGISVYTLDQPDNSYTFTTKTLSGHIDVPLSQNSAQNIASFESVSGDIKFVFVSKLNSNNAPDAYTDYYQEDGSEFLEFLE